ncbi:MAG: DUF6382 domain-containing protein [Lachnospiraceae bacterium]|nr:DUF6382 domain-containing protein [Lachnospiraceae bacterium]
MTIQMIYEINNTYMVIDGSEIETEEDFRHKMLQNNHIKNVIVSETRIINNENKIFIDISGKESLLNRLGTRPADRQEIRVLFESIYCVVENASKYLISESDIVFRPEMIYKNPLTGEYEFTIISFKEKINGKEGMKELLQFLMNNLDNSDEKLVNAIYGIYEMYSDENPRFSTAFEFFVNVTKEKSEQVLEESEETDIFSNNILFTKYRYIPGFKEIVAVSLCVSGLILLGINAYWSMLQV